MRSAPLPNGTMLRPSEPIGASAADRFISENDNPGAEFLRSQEFNIPVPLMHRRTPSREALGEWLTCANGLTRDFSSYVILSMAPYTTPDVPAVAATSP